MLKKTTARYYNEVACYLDGTKKFRAGQSDPVQKVEERVNVTQGAGQCDPLERVNVTPNRDINNNSIHNPHSLSYNENPTNRPTKTRFPKSVLLNLTKLSGHIIAINTNNINRTHRIYDFII